jgi:uncharacterized protein YuzE
MDFTKKQVTYDADAEMGYIYLSEPRTNKIVSTEELPENDDLMIDFGEEVPVIGIELAGKTAKRIAKIVDRTNFYYKELTPYGMSYYSFRINNELIRKSVSHPNAEAILFHFSDENCQDFVGFDIMDTKSYSEKYLIG